VPLRHTPFGVTNFAFPRHETEMRDERRLILYGGAESGFVHDKEIDTTSTIVRNELRRERDVQHGVRNVHRVLTRISATNARLTRSTEWYTMPGGVVLAVVTPTKLFSQCRAHLVLVDQVLGMAVPVTGATASLGLVE
jgi:hypothetical protein